MYLVCSRSTELMQSMVLYSLNRSLKVPVPVNVPVPVSVKVSVKVPVPVKVKVSVKVNNFSKIIQLIQFF